MELDILDWVVYMGREYFENRQKLIWVMEIRK
jgi:hypothetical protein